MKTQPASRCANALATLAAGGDATLPERRAAQQHIDSCPACADLVDQAGADASARVLHALAAQRPAPSRAFDHALLAVAILQFTIAGPWLFGANILSFLSADVTSEHLTRDGAFGLLVGGAGAIVARQARYAVPLLLLCFVAIVGQVIAFPVDSTSGRVHGRFELTHIISLVIIVMIAIRSHWRPAPPNGLSASR